MRDHLYETEVAIQVGVGRYTWQSFNIKKYCEAVKTLMRKLQSIVSQINYIRIDIRNRINEIKKFNIFSIDENNESEAVNQSDIAGKQQPNKEDFKDIDSADSAPKIEIIRVQESSESVQSESKECGTRIYYCQGFMERLNQARTEKCSHMKTIYDSLGPVLVKLESLVLGTYTGRSEKMRDYYVFWEGETYKCILEYAKIALYKSCYIIPFIPHFSFTYKNLECFLDRLTRKEPMFEINAVLILSEIMLEPSSNEIKNMIVQAAKDFLER